MASLLGLPVEILPLILERCDKPALLSLCLVARPFPRLVQPFLYAEINWEWRGDLGPDNHNPRISLFVRTLLERPELGDLVERAQLDIHEFFEESFPPDKEYGHYRGLEWVKLEPKYIDLAMDLAQKMGFPMMFLSSLRQKLDRGHLDALMALLLSQVPSLKSLSVGTFLLDRYDLVNEFLHLLVFCPDMAPPEGPRHFRRLSHVQLGMDKVLEGRYITLAYITPIFYFPAIRVLDVILHSLDIVLGGPGLRQPNEIHSPLPQTLETLRLRQFQIKPSYVAKFLEYMPALKELQCHFLRIYNPRIRWESRQVDFTGLNSSLRLAADTLEYLTVGCVWWQVDVGLLEEIPPTGTEIVPMGPLSALGKLSCVELDMRLLLGSRPWHGKWLSDVLPPNLKELTLVDPNNTWGHISLQDNIDILAEYLSHRPHKWPFLEHVTLRHTNIPLTRSYHSPEHLNGVHADASQLQQLRSMAVSANVTLVFLYNVTYQEKPLERRTVVFDNDNPGVEPFETCNPETDCFIFSTPFESYDE